MCNTKRYNEFNHISEINDYEGGGAVWSRRRKNTDFGSLIGHDQVIGVRPHGILKEYMNTHSAWLCNPGFGKSSLDLA